MEIIDDFDIEDIFVSSDSDTNLDLPDMQTFFHIHPSDIATVSLLSQGDDSHVYSGLYKNKKSVAVKVLLGTALIDDERDDFNSQVQILKRANHENIVKFIGSSVRDESTMMIVLELMKDCKDVERLKKAGLDLVSVVIIALSTAKAMEYLHSQGIIHCNLKPSNILMSQQLVKLTGFGNAIEEVVVLGDTRRLHELEVFSFGKLLQELLQSVTTAPTHLLISQEGMPTMEKVMQLMEACMARDSESRPDFPLIRQDLENIFSSMKQSQKDVIVYGDTISVSDTTTVFEAMYNSRHVAAKVYEHSEVEDEMNEIREKYDRQAEILTRIQHQNIIELIGATTEPRLRLITEFLFGGSLEDFMMDINPDVPNIETTISFALGIAEAMQHLHYHGITHRALDSSHVFLSKDKFFIKIGGFAQAGEEETDEIGFDNYKTDVYDFAQILWELLTNNHSPFEKYISSAKKKRPSLLGVPYDIIELLESCGSEKAEERPEFWQIKSILSSLHDAIPLAELMKSKAGVLTINLPSKREGDEVVDEEGGDGKKKNKQE